MTNCKACGKEIAKSAKTCPHCGAKNKKPPIGCLAVIVLFLLIGAFSSSGGDDIPETTGPNESISQSQPTESNDTSVESTTTPIATTDPVVTTTPADTATMGEKNALKHAISYLNFSAFSYSGLIEQLEYEGYSTEEATYGADNCGADWMEQALRHAKSYLDFSAFSYSGLIDQLEYEGYSTEEATYGVDHCGADWMEQAVRCAKNYLEYTSFSRSGLIEQLEYEGFTHEQAVYGAEQNGY